MVGIDVGTTAVKVAAFGLDGEMLANHSTCYPTRRPRPGWAEQDAEDWWHGVQEGRDAVAKGRKVRAVGIVSQVNTHVLVDEHLYVDNEANPSIHPVPPTPHGWADIKRFTVSRMNCGCHL